jgi:Putative adhesin
MTLTSTVGAPRAPGNVRMTPGRWLALALAVPVALALIGWTAFDFVSLVSQGSYSFSLPVPVHGGQATVNVNGSNVTLRQTPGGAAQLTGIVTYGLFRPGLTHTVSSDGISVSVDCDAIASNCGANGTLDIPTQTAVSLYTGGGDMQAASFLGHLMLSTDGGNVNGGSLGGNLVIYTGGGDLTDTGLTGTIQVYTDGGNVGTTDLSGTVQVTTEGGDLTSNVMSGNLQVLTGGGNVNGNSVSARLVNVQSAGGDVTLVFTVAPTNLQISSGGGNVNVVLPHGDTTYNLVTSPGGGTDSYPSSLVSAKSPNTITVNSGGGDITITEAN